MDARRWIRRALGARTTERAWFLWRLGLSRVHLRHVLDIPGWLTTSEAIALYETVRQLPGPAPVAVEIGSWLGKSSFMIANGLKARPDARLYCIDPFDAPHEVLSRARDALTSDGRIRTTVKDAFWETITTHGLAGTVRMVEGYSHDVIASFSTPIDFLFVDGLHEYDCVLRDVADWSPLVKPDGWIALHDASPDSRHAGPWRVVRERLTPALGWTFERQADSLWMGKRSRRTR